MSENNKTFNIVVVASRNPIDCYAQVLPAVIRVIDVLHRSDEEKTGFTFLHNNVFTGALRSVQQSLDNIGPSLAARGLYIGLKKVPMDVLGHGRVAESRWLDSTLEKKPDAFLIIDDGKSDHLRYAQKIAKENSIFTHTIYIKA